jgi:hypothetical protein
LIFYLSENDRVPVPAMLFILVPVRTGTLKNPGSETTTMEILLS